METPSHQLQNPEGKISEFQDFLKESGLEKVSDNFFDRLATIVVALVGLLAAFAWDEALKEIFVEIFPHASSLAIHLVYAIILTLLTVIISLQAPHVRQYMKFKKILKETMRETMKENEKYGK
jgi:low affinity Fe/Cu permease